MNVNTLVTIFGGSGFLGRYVIRALAERHCRLRMAVRHPYFVEHLHRLGGHGQIRAIRMCAFRVWWSRWFATLKSSSIWSESCPIAERPPAFQASGLLIRRLAILRGARRVGAGGREF